MTNLIFENSCTLVFSNVKYTSLYKLSISFVRINCFYQLTLITMIALYFETKGPTVESKDMIVI